MNKNIKKINKKNYQKGFTLLETLVAIFILTLTITAPVYIATVSFRSTIYNRDTIIAQYLAEEVVEVIRNRRDESSLNNQNINWSAFINNRSCIRDTTTSSDNKCYMEKDTITQDYVFFNCNASGVCPNMSFDPEGDDVVYGDTAVNDITSKFVRELYITRETLTGSNPSGVEVVVNIKWQDKGVNKIYTLTERLYKTDYYKFFIDDNTIN